MAANPQTTEPAPSRQTTPAERLHALDRALGMTKFRLEFTPKANRDHWTLARDVEALEALRRDYAARI